LSVFENILQFTPSKIERTLIKSTDKTGLQGEESQETPRKVQPEKGNGNRMAIIGQPERGGRTARTR
jgi:hypothetical protein